MTCTRQCLQLGALAGSSLGSGQEIQLSNPRVDLLAGGSLDPPPLTSWEPALSVEVGSGPSLICAFIALSISDNLVVFLKPLY